VDGSGSKIDCFVFVIITATYVGKMSAPNSTVDLLSPKQPLHL